ncbi:MAG: phosphate ABC transporter substrate-binding protein, PhoT family [Lachnospiraceae bacterium]|nr:phosphate ABC transporter substrate-binding protein, PhoT family [Lachnospiraceae bacterium]
MAGDSKRASVTLCKQLSVLVLIIAIFAAFNLSIYFVLTRRLANNFSDTSQAKMIDVAAYLPHNPDSNLVRIDSSLKLTDNLPVLDGAAALVPVYAAFVDNVYPEGSVTFEGGVFSDDNFYGENFAPDSKMQYKNTVRGYEAIVDGTTDILFCAAPSADQKKYAEEKGVELVYVPVGLEGFVFFVNEDNPVDNLTVEQVRGIYSGEYTNWKDVGGSNRVINPVTRLTGSGSQSAMDSFMKGQEIKGKSPFALTGGSIGFSFRYYMDDMVGNENVKMLSLNGVYPSAENIKNGTYPIIAQFYAIYRADNTNENIPVLIDWILSEEGQKIIEETGYVSIN